MTVRRGCRLPLEELAPYLLAPPDPPAAISWPKVFGNEHPLEIEVGFGKGMFLVNAAQMRPDVNFLGIEVERKLQLYAATRLAKRAYRNVRVVCSDARLFLPACVADRSVRAVHVYFPDPWWKQRHRKRRVFTPAFATQCVRVLESGGQLRLATDVADYFQLMVDTLGRFLDLRELTPPAPGEPAHDLDYLTNFERKYRQQQCPIYRALYERS
jgi:tRNA (guanine-N7-)-methyltransferase